MTVVHEKDGWYVTLDHQGNSYVWGSYPTALDAQAVENRLLKQFAKEDLEDQRAGKGRREHVPPGWKQERLL